MDRRLFLFASMAALCGAPACAADAPDAAPATIPLDLSGPRPTAQLVIGNSAPVTAIFDTGAAASVLKLEYAQRINTPNQGAAMAHGPSGTPVQGFRTTIAHASLGGAQFDNALAVAFDIPLPLEGVEAIISPSVFSGRLVRFDFAGGVAQVLPMTTANTPREPSRPYVGENTHGMIGRTPGVHVEMPGASPVDAILDTGARRGLSLPLSMAHAIPLLEPMTPDEPQRLVGAQYSAFRARINGSVHIGAITVVNPEVSFADGPTPPIVGFPILRNVVIVLDPAGQRAWLLAPAAH
jgi:hypothetical protein